MTDFRRVTDQLSVAPQIEVADVERARDQGFVLIVNNRPDGESADQTPSGKIEAAARAAGLDYVHIPVMGGPTGAQAQAIPTGSASQLATASAICASMRQSSAAAGRWSRFDTKIAAVAMIRRPQTGLRRVYRKSRAA